MRQMSSVCKMTDNGRLSVDQKVKVVLFYADTRSVVATPRSCRAHFGTSWAPCKQTIYRLSLGTIFQPMRINSVPDVKCFCKNKNVLCVQSIVWHFVRHLYIHLHEGDFKIIKNVQKCVNKPYPTSAGSSLFETARTFRLCPTYRCMDDLVLTKETFFKRDPMLVKPTF